MSIWQWWIQLGGVSNESPSRTFNLQFLLWRISMEIAACMGKLYFTEREAESCEGVQFVGSTIQILDRHASSTQIYLLSPGACRL